MKDEQVREGQEATKKEGAQQEDLQQVIRNVIAEYVSAQQARSAPAHKAELDEERKRREQLERRVNELVAENRQARERALEAERESAVRAELQKLGVVKIELAYKAVKDDIDRGPDGRILAKGNFGELPLRDYLTQFVTENPELLPAKVSGGAGTGAAQGRPVGSAGPLELDSIRPGMSAEEKEKVRLEILRLATPGSIAR